MFIIIHNQKMLAIFIYLILTSVILLECFVQDISFINVVFQSLEMQRNRKKI